MTTTENDMNPEHVNRLNTRSQLEADGFQGPDVSIKISLAEYGIAWRDLGDEWLFVYCIDGGEGLRFDRATIRKDTDPREEWNWADWPQVAQAYGTTAQDMLRWPLPEIVYALVNYWGWENVFGSSYWEGFAIDWED